MAATLSSTTRNLVISRIPDYAKMLQEQQIDAAIRVIAQDFYIYCERNLEILDKKTSDIIPLIPNWAQEKLVNFVLADIAAGRPVRYIILKARQMGLSTIIEALGYWWTTTHRNIKSLIIAHETDSATTLYEMFKRFFDNSHRHFQPDRKYNNKKELVFDVEDKVKEEFKEKGVRSPGLGSSIKTMVAKEGKGRSQMNKFLHGSEVAFWETGADFASAALQTVPMEPYTFVFLESTANGVGGLFYNLWQNAKKGKSNLVPLFFAWHEHYDYELYVEGGCQGQYDDEEIDLMKLFAAKNYPLETWDAKIMWRRMKKKDFVDDPKKFYQEYPKDDMEAFLASGRPRFDTATLQKMEDYANDNECHMFGVVKPNETGMGFEKYIFEEVPETMKGQDPTPLKVWELPQKADPNTHTPAAEYVVGVDVSEGKLNKESAKKENDYSVIEVMRRDNRKTVARWRGHIDPDLLGAIVFALGTFYNNAYVGVEVNNHGLTTVTYLKNHFYRNLFRRKNAEDQQFQETTSLFGFQTNRKTKPKIVDNLAKAIREGDIIDLDIVFIREAMTYIRDDQGATNAQEGCFDDTVMAKAIALYLADYDGIDAEYAKENIQKNTKRNTNATSINNSLESIAAGSTRRTSNRDVVARRRAARAAHKARNRSR